MTSIFHIIFYYLDFRVPCSFFVIKECGLVVPYSRNMNLNRENLFLHLYEMFFFQS